MVTIITKSLLKVKLSNPTANRNVVSRDMSHKQSKKKREKTLTTFISEMERKDLERIKAYVAVSGALAESRV